MESIPVVMVRQHLDNFPAFPLPEEYRIRTFRPGDEQHWAEVETAAGEFDRVEAALARFAQEFGEFTEEMESRCFFVEDGEGRVAGTATAWYNQSFQGEEYGRIHWVGVAPEHQGKGLGRALVTAVMDRLARSHRQAYLTTQTSSAAAIKIYLDFGFLPLLSTYHWQETWRNLQTQLKHPELEAFLKDNA